MTNENKHKAVVFSMALLLLIQICSVLGMQFLISAQIGTGNPQTDIYYIIRSVSASLFFLSYYFLIPLKNKYANDTQKKYSNNTRNAALFGAIIAIGSIARILR